MLSQKTRVNEVQRSPCYCVMDYPGLLQVVGLKTSIPNEGI